MKGAMLRFETNPPLTDFLAVDLKKLEETCFPASWIEPDVHHFYESELKKKGTLSIFVFDSDRVVGFALALPQPEAIPHLLEADSILREDRTLMYLETIQITPSLRGKGYGKKLLSMMTELCRERGYLGLAMHARVSNGFNEIAKQIPGTRVQSSRLVTSWPFGGHEPFEYLELWFVDSRGGLV